MESTINLPVLVRMVLTVKLSKPSPLEGVSLYSSNVVHRIYFCHLMENNHAHMDIPGGYWQGFGESPALPHVVCAL